MGAGVCPNTMWPDPPPTQPSPAHPQGPKQHSQRGGGADWHLNTWTIRHRQWPLGHNGPQPASRQVWAAKVLAAAMLLHIVLLHQTSALLWLAHYDPPHRVSFIRLALRRRGDKPTAKRGGRPHSIDAKAFTHNMARQGGGKRAAKGNQGGGKGLVAPPPLNGARAVETTLPGGMNVGSWKQRRLVETMWRKKNH